MNLNVGSIYLIMIIFFRCYSLAFRTLPLSRNVKSQIYSKAWPCGGGKEVEVLMNSSSNTSIETKVKFLDQILLIEGIVQQGYGRGSKKLGFATANLPNIPTYISSKLIGRGVYFGWASIENEDKRLIFVSNFGKSPTFTEQNSVEIMEAHLIGRESQSDFYGSLLKLCVVGFIRPERKFSTLDALKERIGLDKTITEYILGNNDKLCEGNENIAKYVESIKPNANKLLFNKHAHENS